MFTEKKYIVVCHGCGRFHEYVSAFISAPMSIGFPPDAQGRRWVVPNLGCPECLADPTKPIRHAFDHGMSAAAMARAESEFAAEWRAKLEARKLAAQ